ncbi:MBL fold metallo-hydrolase RNA specificity domain-containing protein [Spiribacter halobius]|uniref:MBL fold hydrolase n=1 Tax=Sediminicurvatus halobius TaxID=2182432 RepID=A0A2U2MXC1_9GAMM|nr:MBL fold metallo-hydrolase [Spiribacter halobius]PWG61446.1 MBL fold hydrolase [Spiribacter halobius]UEX77231.1 MBL fold metallo-hydrolase [Spiribacter halobius]
MEDYPRIEHHGGHEGVTGSCHRLRLGPGQSLLVDCGLFQGEDGGSGDTLERHRIDFPVDDVIALVVTHVHIDHIGRLPYLLAAGYRGPILCSVPSARLLPLVIEDALKIGFTRDERLIRQFLDEVQGRLVALDYGAWHGLPGAGGTRLRLQRAGHILGSAYVEVDWRCEGRRERIVFSGDLGAPYAPLLPAPKASYAADRLVLESTYGDGVHEGRRARRHRLKAAIDQALADGGTVIVPAFSIGRTQELLYEIEGLIHGAAGSRDWGDRRGSAPPTGEGAMGGALPRRLASSPADWPNLEIIVDSPLAARFTEVYRDLRPYWDAEAHRRVRAGRHPLAFDNLYTVDSHEEHLQTADYLARTHRPAVVIAASGMCAGGRVVNYLRRMLPDPRHAVVFVGYQAAGTPGRDIQRYGPRGGWVMLDGERIDIRARIETLGGYSAHADREDLIRFVRRMRRRPREVRLVHGEPNAKRALREALLARGGLPEGARVVL